MTMWNSRRATVVQLLMCGLGAIAPIRMGAQSVSVPMLPSSDSECQALADDFLAERQKALSALNACVQKIPLLQYKPSSSVGEDCRRQWPGDSAGIACNEDRRCLGDAQQYYRLANESRDGVASCRDKVRVMKAISKGLDDAQKEMRRQRAEAAIVAEEKRYQQEQLDGNERYQLQRQLERAQRREAEAAREALADYNLARHFYEEAMAERHALINEAFAEYQRAMDEVMSEYRTMQEQSLRDAYQRADVSASNANAYEAAARKTADSMRRSWIDAYVSVSLKKSGSGKTGDCNPNAQARVGKCG